MHKKFLTFLIIILFLAGGAWYFRDSLKQFPLLTSLFTLENPVEEVSETGLIGHWSMKTNGTTVTDETGNNDGTNSGAVPTPGIVGQALEFDGSTTYVDMGTDSSLTGTSGGFSVCVKIYPHDVTTTQRIVHKGGQDGTNYDYTLAIGGNDVIFGVQTTATKVFGVWTTANNISTANQWYDICGIYDGSSTNKVYIDGVLQASQAASITDTADSNLNIGRRNDGTQFFDGLIDEVRIYNLELTTTEITELYTQGNREISTGGINQGLIAHWSLAEEDLVDADTIADITLNRNDGDITAGSSEGFVADQNNNSARAYDFDGTNTHINLGQPSELDFDCSTDDFTMSVWFKPNSAGNTFIGKARALTSDRQYQLAINSTSHKLLAYCGSSSTVNGNTVVSTGVWHHAVMVVTGGNARIYFDGQLDGGPSVCGSTKIADTDVLIGARRNNDNTDFAYPFDGSMSDIRIYKRALSADEVSTLYQSYHPQGSTGDLNKGLVGYWPLSNKDEVVGETNLLHNWDFTSGWATMGEVIIDNATTFHTGTGGGYRIYKNYVTVGKRYRMTIAGYSNSASSVFQIYNNAATVKYGDFYISSTPNSAIFDFTATTDTTLKIVPNRDNTTYTITSMTLQEIQAGDSTPYGNHGDMYPGTSSGYVTDHKGETGGAYDFDALDTRFDTGSDWIADYPAITISAWIYPEGYGDHGRGNILSDSSSEQTYGTHFQTRLSGQKLGFSSYQTGYIALSETNSISLNTWQHVLVTRSASGYANFYINGVHSGNSNQNSGTARAGATNVFLGSDDVGYGSFDGKISNLRVYNRVLSTDEIQLLYNRKE